MTVTPEWFVALSGVLFAIGAAGVLLRRNALVVLLSIEIMLNAANLALVGFSRVHGAHDGQVFAIMVMAIAASEVVVGLGIVVALSHLRRELDTDDMTELHG
ncbi:MAG: NADH-quinone oxidoreductase subunit NuoK [Thermoleophilia bacterium]|nr:NADH-quinone oxidoreductase subunit NuoK [Thermoleophilia bacterium]